MKTEIHEKVLKIISPSGKEYNIMGGVENRAMLTEKQGYPIISFFTGTLSCILDDYIGVDFTDCNGFLIVSISEDGEDRLYSVFRMSITKEQWEEQYNGRWE